MLNSRIVLSRKDWLFGLGIVGVVAIANFLFSHDSLLLSIIALIVGGIMLYANLRRSFAPTIEPTTVLDRRYLFKDIDRVKIAIGKVSDPSKHQAFSDRVEQISSDLEKNHFRIVVFGTGAAGKTSVINALLGCNAEKTSKDYSILQIALYGETKTKRHISLLDTPSTQAMGAIGQQWQLEAWQLAQNADLLIFVTAGDLTETEYRELQQLVSSGKRVILAFNKTDLYLPRDRQTILAKLQERTSTIISEIDIVAIAAKPNPIKVRQYITSSDNSNAIQEWCENIPPDISALKQRIEEILSNKWEDLLIKNTRSQIENLLQQIKDTLNQERRQDALKLISRYQLIAATTVFANPFPAIDLLAGAAINTQMLIDLAKIYDPDRPLNLKQAQQFALIIARQLLQLGCVEIITSAIASCFKTNALTYAIGGSMQAVTAAYLTHIGGLSFIEYLEVQPESQSSIASLQNICQKTFKTLQSDQFLSDFVTNISNRIAVNS